MMQRLLLAIFLLSLTLSSSAMDNEISGAGSSFASNVVNQWAQGFMAQEKNRVKVTYRSSSSGDGIRSVTARTVDFAISDIPLTATDLSHDDLMQFPVVVGAVVPIVNLPEIGNQHLKLSGQLLADIYLGKITFWDDPAISAINASLRLPHTAIIPVYRSDNSGTSYMFTYYLASSNPTWAQQHGIGSLLKWPVGVSVKGGEGMKQTLQKTNGTIGYLEYGQALRAHANPISLKNKSGEFVSANMDSIRAASASLNWSRASFYETLVNTPGKNSWPILAVSYGLIHQTKTDEDDIKDTVSFMDWIYHRGAEIATSNDLLPIQNRDLIKKIEQTWMGLRNAAGRQVWTLHDEH